MANCNVEFMTMLLTRKGWVPQLLLNNDKKGHDNFNKKWNTMKVDIL